MRYWITDPDQYTEHYIHTDKYIAENSGDFIIEVMPVEDHERVVAELKAQLEHSETKVAWLLHDNEKNVRERDAVIAKQAKVIEVLKACIQKEDQRCGIWHDGRKAIDHAETIERGEA